MDIVYDVYKELNSQENRGDKAAEETKDQKIRANLIAQWRPYKSHLQEERKEICTEEETNQRTKSNERGTQEFTQ